MFYFFSIFFYFYILCHFDYISRLCCRAHFSFFPVEGTLEEPWYEMPPAVFTQEGPVKVATSPMENLLIEHPSMSVYSVVSGTMTSPPVAPDTPPPSPDGWTESQKDVSLYNTDVLQEISTAPPADLSSSTSTLCTMSTSLDSSSDRSNIDELSRRVVAELQAIHSDKLSDSNNNRARIGNQLRSAQERAQEVRISKILKC